MVYAGAVAAGAFVGQTVSLFGPHLRVGAPRLPGNGACRDDRLPARLDRRLGDRRPRRTAVPRASRTLAPPRRSQARPGRGLVRALGGRGGVPRAASRRSSARSSRSPPGCSARGSARTSCSPCSARPSGASRSPVRAGPRERAGRRCTSASSSWTTPSPASSCSGSASSRGARSASAARRSRADATRPPGGHRNARRLACGRGDARCGDAVAGDADLGLERHRLRHGRHRRDGSLERGRDEDRARPRSLARRRPGRGGVPHRREADGRGRARHAGVVARRSRRGVDRERALTAGRDGGRRARARPRPRSRPHHPGLLDHGARRRRRRANGEHHLRPGPLCAARRLPRPAARRGRPSQPVRGAPAHVATLARLACGGPEPVRARPGSRSCAGARRSTALEERCSCAPPAAPARSRRTVSLSGRTAAVTLERGAEQELTLPVSGKGAWCAGVWVQETTSFITSRASYVRLFVR